MKNEVNALIKPAFPIPILFQFLLLNQYDVAVFLILHISKLLYNAYESYYTGKYEMGVCMNFAP